LNNNALVSAINDNFFLNTGTINVIDDGGIIMIGQSTFNNSGIVDIQSASGDFNSFNTTQVYTCNPPPSAVLSFSTNPPATVPAGTPCQDGNPGTINSVMDADCNCLPMW